MKIVLSIIISFCLLVLISCEDNEEIKSIKLLFPHGEEKFNADSNYVIKWESNYSTNINVLFSVDSGHNWQLASENIASDLKEYLWNVPSSVTEKGMIKIVDASNDNIFDETDKTFSIFIPLSTLLDNIKYYPLHVGDIWVYNMTHSGFYVEELFGSEINYLVKKEIVKDSIIFGNKYFLVRETPIIDDSLNEIAYKNEEFQRVDILNGRIKLLGVINRNGEYSWINLAMQEGESESRGSGTDYLYIELLSEELIDVLGVMSQVKKYKKKDTYISYNYNFAKNIGLIWFKQSGEGIGYNMVLKGAKIGSEIIGDTSLTK